MEDVTQETETAMNTTPTIAKKTKEKYKTKYQQIYTENWENDKSRKVLRKKKKARLRIDIESSLEWLRRGQLNWDGEQIIINAQDQGRDTHE